MLSLRNRLLQKSAFLRHNRCIEVGKRYIKALTLNNSRQEKGHSASLLSHAQPEQAGLDKQFLESKIRTCLNICWCSK